MNRCARYWEIIQAQIAEGLTRRVPGLVFPLCDEAMDRNVDIVASLAPQVEAVAQVLSDEGQHQEAGRYFDYAHRLWRRVGETAASRRCQALQGESLVTAATDSRSARIGCLNVAHGRHPDPAARPGPAGADRGAQGGVGSIAGAPRWITSRRIVMKWRSRRLWTS
jgi:hypothetical protein